MKMLLSAAAFVALFVAPLVVGQAKAQDTAVAARHSDLDLANPADVAKLDRRIGAAARSACGKPSAADLVAQNAIHRCRAEARQTASLQRSQALAATAGPEPTRVASASPAGPNERY